MRTQLAAFGAALLTVASAAAATLAMSTKDDGIPSSESVNDGQPIGYVIEIVNSGPSALDQVHLRDVFDACLDVAEFDPAADPSQVMVTPGPDMAYFR